jgi:hypothetical protein
VSPHTAYKILHLFKGKCKQLVLYVSNNPQPWSVTIFSLQKNHLVQKSGHQNDFIFSYVDHFIFVLMFVGEHDYKNTSAKKYIKM